MDKTLELPDGSFIVMKDVLGASSAPDQKKQNILRLSSGGKLLWRISGPVGNEEESPYTNIYFGEDGKLCAYNWSGATYEIDQETGSAKFCEFLK